MLSLILACSGWIESFGMGWGIDGTGSESIIGIDGIELGSSCATSSISSPSGSSAWASCTIGSIRLSDDVRIRPLGNFGRGRASIVTSSSGFSGFGSVSDFFLRFFFFLGFFLSPIFLKYAEFEGTKYESRRLCSSKLLC